MIEMRVEKYCHNCDDFEPKATSYYDGDKPFVTIVTCVNNDRCKRLVNFIKSIDNCKLTESKIK